MKIYVTLDCIKLTNAENTFLSLIKGIMYDFYHAVNGNPLYPNAYDKVLIEVKETDGMCRILVKNSSPGLFREFKKLATPFMFGLGINGGFDDESRETLIVMNRFTMAKDGGNYFCVPKSITA